MMKFFRSPKDDGKLEPASSFVSRHRSFVEREEIVMGAGGELSNTLIHYSTEGHELTIRHMYRRNILEFHGDMQIQAFIRALNRVVNGEE